MQPAMVTSRSADSRPRRMMRTRRRAIAIAESRNPSNDNRMFKSGNGWGNSEDGPGRPFVVASPRVTKKNDTQGKAANAMRRPTGRPRPIMLASTSSRGTDGNTDGPRFLRWPSEVCPASCRFRPTAMKPRACVPAQNRIRPCALANSFEHHETRSPSSAVTKCSTASLGASTTRFPSFFDRPTFVHAVKSRTAERRCNAQDFSDTFTSLSSFMFSERPSTAASIRMLRG